MSKIEISDAVRYIGCDDHDLDLFESQYIVPNGMAYNSYLILDDKVAIMDTVDPRGTDEWMKNLETELGVDLELEEKLATLGELADFLESKLD